MPDFIRDHLILRVPPGTEGRLTLEQKKILIRYRKQYKADGQLFGPLPILFVVEKKIDDDVAEILREWFQPHFVMHRRFNYRFPEHLLGSDSEKIERSFNEPTLYYPPTHELGIGYADISELLRQKVEDLKGRWQYQEIVFPLTY